jgi:hypothetical protein
MSRHLFARITRIFGIVRLMAAAMALLGGSLAQASFVEIDWDEDGTFEFAGEVAVGEAVEVCGALVRGERVHWAFEASAAVDFNIHYHVEDEVVYPASVPGAVKQADLLRVPVDQTYCWMWTALPDAPATVTLQLSR